MRASQIKAELNERRIDFTDCFDKESLADKLSQARAGLISPRPPPAPPPPPPAPPPPPRQPAYKSTPGYGAESAWNGADAFPPPPMQVPSTPGRPPVDASRRGRSPGIASNFYDTPQSDFKRPYGSGGGASPPSTYGQPQGPPQGYGAPSQGHRAQSPGYDAQPPPGYDAQPPPGYGAQPPPGYGAQQSNPGQAARPPVDGERRRKSPGIGSNFYDTPQSDFKRPYGSGGGATPPSTYGGGAAPASQQGGYSQPSGHMPQQGRPAGHMPQDGYGYGAAGGASGPVPSGPDPMAMRASEIKAELKERRINFNDCFDKESLAAKLNDARAGIIKPPPPPQPRGAARGFEFGAESRQGEDMSMDDVFAAAGWNGDDGKDPTKVDTDRSPGLQRNFVDISQSDFKKPYTGGGGGRKGRYDV